jgi:hypothetical protein
MVVRVDKPNHDEGNAIRWHVRERLLAKNSTHWVGSGLSVRRETATDEPRLARRPST